MKKSNDQIQRHEITEKLLPVKIGDKTLLSAFPRQRKIIKKKKGSCLALECTITAYPDGGFELTWQE